MFLTFKTITKKLARNQNVKRKQERKCDKLIAICGVLYKKIKLHEWFEWKKHSFLTKRHYE
jgi:hypothetical protein